MIASMRDHARWLRACADPRATTEEREILSYCAAMTAAREPITRAEYLACEALVGGALSLTTPIYDRPMP